MSVFGRRRRGDRNGDGRALACREVEALLRPHLEGEMAGAETAAVESHLAGCPSCTRRAAQFAAVLRVVRDDAPPPMAADFTARLRARRDSAPLPAPAATARGRAAGGWAARLTDLIGRGRGLSLGLSAAAALVLIVWGVLLAPAPRITAQEVTTRVQESWSRLQDYHCILRTRSRYRGGVLETWREQWFQKPDRFRIESNEGQRRITLISGARVLTYLPDAGVALLRPRAEDEPDLPFPFRSAADQQGDVTVDALLARLRETKDAELVDREEILGKPCYVLKFEVVKPPRSRGRRPRSFDCRMWVDGETFLPLKLKMHRNWHTWSYTRATGLEVNLGLPASLFEPHIPEGVHWLRGDVDLRLFEHAGAALLRNDLDPVAETDAVRRRLSFPVLTPSWLPRGYRLVAAVARPEALRNRVDRRFTLTLVNDAGDLLTIVQEPPAEGAPSDLQVAAGSRPYPHVRLSGERAGALVRIRAANLSRGSVLHLFEGLQPADAPPPAL